MERSIKDYGQRVLGCHRRARKISCLSSCWCWELEKLLMKIEAEGNKQTMDDDQIYERGGTEKDIEEYAIKNGAFWEHNTDSEDCWCEPEIEIYDDTKIIIHRDRQ